MQVSLEAVGVSHNALEYRMTVDVPGSQVQSEVQERLKSLARTARLKGFRPGKVPMRVIEQKFGKQIRQEIVEKIITDSFREVLEREKVSSIIEQPVIQMDEAKTNLQEGGLSYIATFKTPFSQAPMRFEDLSFLKFSSATTPLVLDQQSEINSFLATMPPVQWEGLAVEKPLVEVTEADVDTMLQRLLEQIQQWHLIDEPAQEGDKVVVDLEGTVENEPPRDMQAKRLSIILGKNSSTLPPEVEHALLGLKTGEDREVEIEVPEERQASLGGTKLRFKVHVDAVARGALPPLDTEFAKMLGVEDGNVETLRRETRENMQEQLRDVTTSKMKEQLFTKLLALNPVEPPEFLATREKQRLFFAMREMLEEQQTPLLNVTPERLAQEADKRSQAGLLVAKLAQDHAIEPNEDEIRQRVEKIASVYQEPDSIVQWYYEKPLRLNEIKMMLLEEKVVTFLLEKVQVTENNTDFYSIMT